MGCCKILRDSFCMNVIPSSLSAAVFLPRLLFDLFDLCSSVCPFCLCVPGRSLSWGISCCLVCIICPVFVNVALIISAFSSLDFSL